MSIVHQVLAPGDLDEIYNYANERLARAIPDENDRMFASWTVAWRREALEHYLKLGWSFIAREEAAAGSLVKAKVVGFFLAQPFLFFRGQTQTLWLEHVEADDDSISKELVSIAIRVAREKHLQRVLIANSDKLEKELAPWSPTQLSDEDKIAVVKTTKG